MDPLTHIVAGGAAGQAVRRWFPGKAIVPFAVLAAWIPDIDNFISADPEFYLLHHRGLTHSFAGGLVLAGFLAGIFWAWKRKQGWGFGRLFLFAYACVLLHIFLDWINNYGTQVFAPFSDYRAALGSVFIIDPLLTGTLLVLFACSLKAGLPRKPVFGAAAVGVLLAYPLLNFAIKSSVERTVAAELEEAGIAHQSVAASPDAFAPFRWKIIVSAGDQYLMNAYRVFAGDWRPDFQAHRRPDPAELRRLGEEESFFATWKWFSDYIAVEENTRNGNRRLMFSDLRFESLHPWARRLRPDDRPPPFSLEAELDPDGNLLNWQYHGPSIGSRMD